MKAKEYVEKYCDKIASGDNSVMRELFLDLSQEVISLCKSRNVRFAKGQISVIKEVNEKWNAIARKMKKEKGEDVLREDGFILLWRQKLPELSMVEKSIADENLRVLQ